MQINLGPLLNTLSQTMPKRLKIGAIDKKVYLFWMEVWILRGPESGLTASWR